MITFVQDRLGHDYRYAIDSKKIQYELGWKPIYSFEDGIKETILWYLNNKIGGKSYNLIGNKRVRWNVITTVLVTGAQGQLGKDLVDY